MPDEATHYWGLKRDFFISKLGKGLFTIVGSYQSDPDSPDAPYKTAKWNSEGDVNILKEYYKDWSPLIKGIIDTTPHVRIYPNTSAHALDTWILGDGRVTLAGDAAHAHGGAFAAGGSLALDDAWAFSASLRHVFPDDATSLPTQEDLGAALGLYERTRKAHTDRLMRVVQEGNESKVARLGRTETEEELRARAEGRGDTGWIHEHDVVAAFARAREEEGKGWQQARL